MPIYKVQNLHLVAQPKNALCWWASDTMLYNWSQATGRGAMTDPLDDSGFKWRYDNNATWGCPDNTFMANTLHMKTIDSISMDYSSLVSAFASHGPIFASVQKNWGGNDYGHAIVLGGVADTGVLVYDPMPVGKGSIIWLTWAQINKALDGVADVANPAFLAAV